MSADAGLPKITMMVSAVAIAFAGILAFVVLRWTDSNAAVKEAQALMETEVAVAEEEIRSVLEEREAVLGSMEERTNVLVNGKLSVCNFSSEPVRVALLAATYITSEGTFETFNSQEFGRGLWGVGPGERQGLTYTQGGVTWGGDVIYYSMWLEAGGQEYPFAGTWPVADAEFCVRWTGA